jgi:hypothetical protein
MLYDPIYAEFGVEAELSNGTLSDTISAIDKTEGIDIEAGGLSLPTIKPAACVRMAELTAKGFTPSSLHDGSIVLNGNAWTIDNTKPKPGPNGKGSGELYLILLDGNR